MSGVIDSSLSFGREICGELLVAERREWLVTNGLGGYASGTVAGLASRRYHGLLIASLSPPVERILMASGLDERVVYDGETYALSTSRWSDGTVDPEGYRYLEQFCLQSRNPVWTYALGDARVTKRVGMPRQENATFVRYRVARSSSPLRFEIKLIINNRDHHHLRNDRNSVPTVGAQNGILRVIWPDGRTLQVESSRGQWMQRGSWYENYYLAEEDRRGLPCVEHHYCVAHLETECSAREELVVWIGEGERGFPPVEEVISETRNRVQSSVRSLKEGEQTSGPPAWISRLAEASNDFVVQRPLSGKSPGWSVIAGYPWFTDWGRDTMIGLPGLLLCTGRESIAKEVLRTFVNYLDRGMIPNRFPEAGQTPEYNTVDATLWLVEAMYRVWERTRDKGFLREMYPSLQEIVKSHREGTRHGISMDGSDGLLKAGEEGLQLTWMDAKVGDEVITPRHGKPVEVNALWYNALRVMGQFSGVLGESSRPYNRLANRTRRGFKRFWNPDTGACFDVLDGPQGDEPAVRPNQILAVGLTHSPLEEQLRAPVVDVCLRRLLTTFGLRSLDSGHPDYQCVYEGSPEQRDRAYHQGTVWSWWMGPLVRAYLRVHENPGRALKLLNGFRHHIYDHGLGSVSEIFDGEPPHRPRGCPFQAWGVAQVLQAWDLIQRAK